MVVKTDRSRILIVDDEPENIWPLVKHLEDEYEILCATDGEQAIEIAFSSDKPDMILLDIIMPGMDGYELCSRLKADARTRNIPLIFLTARNDEVDETRGLEMGAQDYITKPFSLPVVRARIKSVLNLKKELDRRHLLKTQLEEFNAQLEEQVQKKMEELQKTREALKFYEDKYRRLFREKGSGKTRRRILVVDDTPENVHILINNLQARFEILCAVSGQDALEIAYSDNPPDLVLLDIMMPGMDGFEVCSRLKANADTWDIPVIFVTALGQDVDEAKGLNLGAVDFITKPFSIPVVEARIRAALRLKEEMDQRIRLTRQLEGLNEDLEHRVREKTAALKQAHEDLLASEKKYRNIYENAPEGIFQVSIEGRFLSANPAMARILGYSSPEEMLASLTDVRRQVYVDPSERDELISILDEQTAVVGHELQFFKKDGQIACGSISVRVVRDHEGRPVFLEGFFTDVTERKRLEEQLRQAAKMEAVGTLVGGVAHDFNNLMTAVIGYSDLLLATMGGDDPSRGPLEVIRKAGESAATLTKRLLAFSRKQVLQPVVLDINTVVANIEKMLRRMIGEDIELVALPGHSLRPVLADPRPDRAGHYEPGRQCPRCNAPRRKARHRNGQCVSGRKLLSPECRRAARPLCRTVDERHGHGHEPRYPGAHVRTFLYNQEAWKGDRPGAGHGLRNSATEPRAYPGLQAKRARARRSKSIFPSPRRRPKSRSSLARHPKDPVSTPQSWLPRTTPSCAS